MGIQRIEGRGRRYETRRMRKGAGQQMARKTVFCRDLRAGNLVWLKHMGFESIPARTLYHEGKPF